MTFLFNEIKLKKMKTSNKLLVGAMLLSMFIFTAFMVIAKNSLKPGEVRTGSGEIVIDKRDISPFDKISCYSGFVVEVVKSDEYYVQVETYENIQDIVVVDIKDDLIEIKTQGRTSLNIEEPVKIKVGCPEITEIKVADAVDLTFNDDVVGDSLSIKANSAAEVDGNTNLQFLSLDVSSAANIDIDGSANNAIIECTSAGSIDGEDFQVNEVDAIVTSAGSVEMNVLNRLVANATSGGNFKYSGDPRTSINANSGGTISKAE